MNESEILVQFEIFNKRISALEERVADYDASFSKASDELKELKES